MMIIVSFSGLVDKHELANQLILDQTGVTCGFGQYMTKFFLDRTYTLFHVTTPCIM